MTIRKMQHCDLRSVNAWLRKHGRLEANSECCELSYIIPGVASVQLLRAEHGVAIMDSLCTNPLVSASTRNKALNQLFTFIKQKSVELGYNRLLGFTTSESTLNRAMQHGWQVQSHILLTLET